jgi:hypothetical protein
MAGERDDDYEGSSDGEPLGDAEARLQEVEELLKSMPPDTSSQLDVIEKVLDLLPPDTVREALVEAGASVAAVDVMADLAKNADDPLIRAEARRRLEESGLGLVLHSEDDDPNWGSSLTSG